MVVPAGILCEACGYDISTLDADGACPECGRPIPQSLPGHRLGSPWQRRHAISTWLTTFRQMLASPRRLFSRARVDNRSGQSLFFLNLTIASLIPLLAGLSRLGTETTVTIQTGPTTFNVIGSNGPLWALMGAAPWLAMGLDALTTPFTYRRRGWRISRPVYRTVRAHASFAWVLFGLIIALLALAETPALRAAVRSANPTLAQVAASFSGLVLISAATYVAILHHIGLKACRYASELPAQHPSTDPIPTLNS